MGDMSVTSQSRNRLLAGAESAETNLLTLATIVELRQGDVVLRRNETIAHAFFPLSGSLSTVFELRSRFGVEVQSAGREGFSGVPLINGADRTPTYTVVRLPGHAVRIAADALRGVAAEHPPLAAVLQRYRAYAAECATRSVACAAVHSVAERLAHLLLASLDRIDGLSIPLTHDALASMLGVRRATITDALGYLRERGAIEKGRGSVDVRDRAALARIACLCYASNVDSYARIVLSERQGAEAARQVA